MQHDHVGLGAKLALAVIRRWSHLGHYTGIGSQRCHERNHTPTIDDERGRNTAANTLAGMPPDLRSDFTSCRKIGVEM
jgi:hypothetical protein